MDLNSTLEPLHPLSKTNCPVGNETIPEMLLGTSLQSCNLNECDQSANTSISKVNLDDQVSSKPSKSQYSCQLCNMSFDDVSCSAMLTHNCEKQYQQINDETPIGSSVLENCIENQYEAEELQCDVCHKILCSKQSLKRHLRMHTGETPYQCEVCDKAYIDACSLAKHKLTHTQEKPYQCEVCDKCFRQKWHLAEHKLTHDTENPFQCTVCCKAFNTNSCLTRHLLIHTKEKPYHCEICGKCFRHKHHLTKHMLTHTGEKPFRCELCGECFRKKKCLNEHVCLHS